VEEILSIVDVASEPWELQARFRIERELARGGVGVVYVAFDRSTKRRVALKRLGQDAPSQLAALFEREFYVLSSLRHPSIIEVYEYGIDQGTPFYTMELLEGMDLRELSPIDPPLACRYLRDVASSLALLHARGLIHRDVSPRNVRTTPDGGSKLIDFGALASFGVAGDIVGTPPAMAPEVLHGRPLDQRADLFSLGALAYFALTGRHAYPARRVSELAGVWEENPLPPSAYAPTVPGELDELVLSLLALDVLARPSSAAEVIDRLTVIGRLPPERDVGTARAYLQGTSVVEREAPLDRVARRIARAKTGRGASVFVDGDPGVGRSRFLSEAAMKAKLAGVTVVRADAAVHSGPLAMARALTWQLVKLVPDVAERALRPHAGLVARVFPDVGSELGFVEPDAAGGSGAGAAELSSALEDAFLAVSRERPLVVLVDDVDRSDLESAALLVSLSREAPRHELVVITTALALPWSELSAPVRFLRDQSTDIRLRGLTEDGVLALVRSAFGNVPHAPRTAARLYEVTDGNPEHCMRLVEHWVETGVVTYADGVWSLPIELPDEAFLRFEGVALGRLARTSPEARALAEALSLFEDRASVDLCIALASPSGQRSTAVALLDELTGAEILAFVGGEYRYRQDVVRAAVARRMPEERRRALHERFAELLLGGAAEGPSARFSAGSHLIQAGHETRGADLVASTARELLAGSSDPTAVFARAVPAFEAALDVYRKQGRKNLELLGLLVPMALASYDVSFEFAQRYGEEAIARLRRAIGLGTFEAPVEFPDASSLFGVLAAAPLLEDGEQQKGDTPDVGTLVTWLVRCAMTLTGAFSAAIAHESEERCVAALEPFRHFGEGHPAAFAHEFCALVLAMTADRMAEAYGGWTSLLARMKSVALPPDIVRRLEIGAITSLGILEAQLDDRSALARVEELERAGDARSAAVAHQLRFLHHGFRGEIELAERSRERLEALAMKRGAAWQVETWSTCTLSAVYGNTRDTTGGRRTVEQLERLKKGAPSLELYWKRALAAQRLVVGDAASALAIYDELDACEPRARVGWGAVRGAAVRARNLLGRHAEALRLAEDTIRLSEEDRDYVAMNLSVWLERSIALAGLGEYERAKSHLEELFSRYRENQNPMTMGCLHRTFAEIALFEGARELFEHHVSEMERWFRSTQNPALVAQCEALRHGFAKRSGELRSGVQTAAFVVTNAITLAGSVLASCRGASERKARSLELLADKAGGEDAFLFGLGEDENPVLVTSLRGVPPSPELTAEVRELCGQYLRQSEETSFVDGSQSETMSPVPAAPHRLFPLTVQRGAERFLLGVIAVPMGSSPRLVSHGLVQDIANQLFQAGDVTAVRLAG
jgi:tetratricopeptide (TPR) repeat protein